MVVIGSDPKGQVESVGYMTTKVRTLDGQLLIYTNRQFATARIMNCSRQPHRLVTLAFKLAPSSSAADLRGARECGQQAVEEVAGSEAQESAAWDGPVRWSDYNMRFYGVWVDDICGSYLPGAQFSLYFYLDGTASKALEFESKTLVYVSLV